jgi:hypothetical protein
VSSHASAFTRIPFNNEERALPETPLELLAAAPSARSRSVNRGTLGLAANARRKWHRWRSRLGISRRRLLGATG